MAYADTVPPAIEPITLFTLLDYVMTMNNAELNGPRFQVLAEADKKIFRNVQTIIPFVQLKVGTMGSDDLKSIPHIEELINRLDFFVATVKEEGAEKAYSVIDVNLLRGVLDKLLSGIYSVELGVTPRVNKKKGWW